MTSWLVSPSSLKATENEPAKTFRAKMQINDRRREGATAVVITFDSKDPRALRRLGYLQDRREGRLGALHRTMGSARSDHGRLQ